MAKNKVYGELEEKLKKLEELSFQDLQRRYYLEFGQKTLSKHRENLLRKLSYRLQERVLGGLPRTLQNKLDRLAFGGQEKAQDKFQLQAGTRLLREWNGRQYHVLVCDAGFEYDGKTYKSLTAIARFITGVPWSGPVFFGIKSQNKNIVRYSSSRTKEAV